MENGNEEREILMIELKDDSLIFRFPETREAIDQLINDEIEKRISIYTRSYTQSVSKWVRIHNIEQDLERMFLNYSKKELISHFQQLIESESDYIVGSDSSMEMSVSFHRTVRVPDDGNEYSLPASLGHFNLKHVDDFEDNVPVPWLSRGGVMMPIYQSEAMWMSFSGICPFALKVGTGKINAVNGEIWNSGLNSFNQDYVVIPEQPWLDGYNIGHGNVRQFVASTLGAGNSVEEQISGRGIYGGIQLEAFTFKAKSYYEKFIAPHFPDSISEFLNYIYSKLRPYDIEMLNCNMECSEKCMGLGMGGRINQEIYQDPYEAEIWETKLRSRCYIHLCNSLEWEKYTGESPHHKPIDIKTYEDLGIPWFDYYSDSLHLEAPKAFENLNDSKNKFVKEW